MVGSDARRLRTRCEDPRLLVPQPIRLALRGAVALDAAQRNEWLRFPDDEVLASAARVARLPTVTPDRVWRNVAPWKSRCPCTDTFRCEDGTDLGAPP